MSLLNDTKISQNVDFVQLSSLIDNYFLSGGNIELTNNEQDIINSKPMYIDYRYLVLNSAPFWPTKIEY